MNRIPVLTYHSLHAPGEGYTSNDHVALETDLQVIRMMKFNIAPLTDIARYVAGTGAAYLASGAWVGLSFDDGPDWDYHDFRADGRRLKSFFTLLRAAVDVESGFQPCAVSFVIASPDARAVLDRICIAGRGNWRDTWWEDAARSGILAIGNHSWDHAHPEVSPDRHRAENRDSFFGIAFYRTVDGALNVIGYIHYSFFEDMYLIGGMVMDERFYRRIPVLHRKAIKGAGGIAEKLLRDTISRFPDAPAIWAHVGNKLAHRVTARVGFRATSDPHVILLSKDGVAEEDIAARFDHVVALGPF
jgi:hypothetical protein